MASATDQRELSGRLAGLSLPRQVLALAVWPFFEQSLGFLVNLVDVWIAGRLATGVVASTNGVAVGGYIEWLITQVQMMVGVGAAAIIARAIGGRHRGAANAALGQAVVLTIALGVAVGLLVFALAPTVGRFVELDADSHAACVTYLRWLALAAPFSGILFVGSAALRASGDTRTPFHVMVVVNLVNTAASLLLALGPAPWGGHGVAGIAIGTVAAWIVGAGLTLSALYFEWGGVRLHIHRLAPNRAMAHRIVRVGLPSLMESLGIWCANFFGVLKIIGHIGSQGTPAAPGAHMIAVRIEAISYLPAMAIASAASVLVGQYLGLGDAARARRAAVLCWKFAAALMTGVGLLFFLVPQLLVRAIASEPVFLELVPPLLRVCGPVQVFFATSIVLSGAMRGAGATRTTLAVSYLCMFCVRLPLAFVAGVWLGGGLRGVWLALCGELIVRGCVFAWMFRRGAWMKVKV